MSTPASPEVVAAGSDEVTLSVEGEGFLSTSVVRFADRWLRTERLDERQLEARLPAALLATVGSYPVRVEHLPPERGRTNILYFIVKFE